MEVLQNYQNVERDYRQRYRQRVERQFKIGECFLCVASKKVPTLRVVKPDATPEEVAAVVNDTEGSGAQIFTQAVSGIARHFGRHELNMYIQLSSSTRYGESRLAFREVQDRHQDIQKIERTLEELAQLFNDVSVHSPHASNMVV